MSSEIAIEIKNVSKKYLLYSKPIDRLLQYLKPKKALHKEFIALQPVSLSIHKGRTIGIVGRNGSGKSTLLQMIAGTLTPTTGSVEVKGRISALLELGAGFNPEFTGRENVFLNAAILGISPKEVEARFQEILAFSEIGEFIDRPVKTYSSGMFVRLAFSVATLIDPDVVIIDEALSVGDEKFQRKCYNHLETLKEKGCTILFVSHSMKTVEQLCDYAYLLDKGELLGEGEPKEIIDQYHLMLYAQENTHMKQINQNNKVAQSNQNVIEEQIEETNGYYNENTETKNGMKMFDIKMFKEDKSESYLFDSGEYGKINVNFTSYINESDIMIGLRIKTTQGVEVYGTSSIYHEMEIDVKENQSYLISFDQCFHLASGIYHVSVAIAKKIGSNDMIYYDKLSDHIFFKIEERPLLCTGIANLNANIQVVEV